MTVRRKAGGRSDEKSKYGDSRGKALTLEGLRNLVRIELLGVLVPALDSADLHRVPGLLSDLDTRKGREAQGVVVDLLKVGLDVGALALVVLKGELGRRLSRDRADLELFLLSSLAVPGLEGPGRDLETLEEALEDEAGPVHDAGEVGWVSDSHELRGHLNQVAGLREKREEISSGLEVAM